MAKIREKDAKIKDCLEKNYSSRSGEFASIDPDYTFGEFWDAFKHGGDFTGRLNITDEDVMRRVLGKIQWISSGKFRITERDFKEKLPLNLLGLGDLMDRVLKYLTEEKGYFIHAGDTHRWISCDGWYELEYHLCYNNGKDLAFSIYLNTYSTSNQGFEDTWKSSDGHTIGYDEIIWGYSDDDFDYRYAFEQMLENEHVLWDIPEDMLSEIQRRVPAE